MLNNREAMLRAKTNGNGRIPRFDKLRKCIGCKCVITGHSPYFEFCTIGRMIKPAAVIGSEPELLVSPTTVASFCGTCGSKVSYHVKDGLAFMFSQIVSGIAQAEAAKDAEDAVGDIEDKDEDSGLILP